MREGLNKRYGEPFVVRREYDGIDLTGREPLEQRGAWDVASEADGVIEAQAAGELFRLCFESAAPAR